MQCGISLTSNGLWLKHETVLTERKRMDDQERRDKARRKLAQVLTESLDFALGAGLESEAAIIAALITACLTGTTNTLMIALLNAK